MEIHGLQQHQATSDEEDPSTLRHCRFRKMNLHNVVDGWIACIHVSAILEGTIELYSTGTGLPFRHTPFEHLNPHFISYKYRDRVTDNKKLQCLRLRRIADALSGQSMYSMVKHYSGNIRRNNHLNQGLEQT